MFCSIPDVIGGDRPYEPDSESSLQLQWGHSVATPIPVVESPL